MITVEKWAGLATNASPYAIPSGAAVTQVNLQIINPGQIQVRPGATTVTFTTHSATTSPVRVAFRSPAANNDRIVYQNSLGQIIVAQGAG